MFQLPKLMFQSHPLFQRHYYNWNLTNYKSMVWQILYSLNDADHVHLKHYDYKYIPVVNCKISPW